MRRYRCCDWGLNCHLLVLASCEMTFVPCHEANCEQKWHPRSLPIIKHRLSLVRVTGGDDNGWDGTAGISHNFVLDARVTLGLMRPSLDDDISGKSMFAGESPGEGISCLRRGKNKSYSSRPYPSRPRGAGSSSHAFKSYRDLIDFFH
jgi:hypothetical protein